MPVDRSVWVVVRRGLREDVNTYTKDNCFGWWFWRILMGCSLAAHW